MQLVRIDDVTQFDPWFVAGALSRTANTRVAGRASSVGSTMRRIDVRRLAIPVLPLNQQQIHEEAFRRLAEFKARLKKITATGEVLSLEINEGLLKGSLTVYTER